MRDFSTENFTQNLLPYIGQYPYLRQDRPLTPSSRDDNQVVLGRTLKRTPTPKETLLRRDLVSHVEQLRVSRVPRKDVGYR